MGRPAKLTPDVQKRICDAIAAGNYYEAAAAYGGIDDSTFRRWMERGERETKGEYRTFRAAVLEATAQAEVSVVAHWKKSIPDNWQAARDFLARRYPDRWGPKERQDVTLKGDLKEPIRFINVVPPEASDGG